MAGLRCPAIVYLCVLSAATALADNTQTNVLFRLALDLADGSHIIGRCDMKSFPMETSYGRMTIPLDRILKVEIQDDHKQVAVELQNGDKLTGTINLKSVDLTMLFGKVSVGISLIKSMTPASTQLLGGGTGSIPVRDKTIEHRGGKTHYRFRTLSKGVRVEFFFSRDGTSWTPFSSPIPYDPDRTKHGSSGWTTGNPGYRIKAELQYQGKTDTIFWDSD